MSRNCENKKLQELLDNNVPVYSYSRLSIYSDGCKYNYYLSYVKGEKSGENIYSKIGSIAHDSIENVYHEKETLIEAKEKFINGVIELEKNGIKFPENPPTTKSNYISNMEHFYDNYDVLDTPMRTEQFVLLNIPRFEGAKNDIDFIWIQMYIDSIMPIVENDEIVGLIINDWKTSSKFDKDKLLKASRQLLLYKLGLEQMTGIYVKKLGWTMMKYVYCCYWTKGSKLNPPAIKRSMQERKSIIKFFNDKIMQDLLDIGVDTMNAEILLSKVNRQNDLKLLPQSIQDKYWIEDCFLEYEFNEDKIKECKEWVLDTVNEIESITVQEEINYPPVEINAKTDYFCINLCVRPNCPYLLKYKCDNIDAYKKKKGEKRISNTIGSNKNINLDKLFNK